jgi:tRNA pseudouridine synthase A
MVRNIMGALVYVGSGRISVDEFESVFHAKSRLKAPPTFMSDGLYLTGVDYPDEFGVTQLSLPEWMSVLGNDFQTD